MVEYTLNLDKIFFPGRFHTSGYTAAVTNEELSVGEIARPYELSFAAVSKHLKVLERAKLIIKRRRGKEQMVQLAPQALADAAEYLQWYQQLMEARLDGLDNYLKQEV